jgi:hypothetical protein
LLDELATLALVYGASRQRLAARAQSWPHYARDDYEELVREIAASVFVEG